MSVELLAPAGSLTGLKAVTAAGADAVYIGGAKFGARAYADNPDEDSLISGIEYAHLRGVKVYLTVNTLLKDNEISALVPYIRPFYDAGVDAVLVQDFGVLKVLHTAFPDLPLHASTQMTVTGPDWANILKEYGVTRIVPARELSFEEIRRLKKDSGLEVEVFVHGALCVCYSGQCLYSSMIGGRSGNRGRCAQPCRLLYLKNEDLKAGASIVEDPRARHFLSPKDLNASDEIAALLSVGADSLKIEGRMKRPEYAAGVTSIYRKYVDLVSEGKNARVTAGDRQKLYDLYNRSGFTDGYFSRHNGPEMMAMVKHELTPAETRKRADLLSQMHEKYIAAEKKIPVRCVLDFYAGKRMRITYSKLPKAVLPEKTQDAFPGPETGEASFTVFSDLPVEAAKTRPLGMARLKEAVMKTGDTDFTVAECEINTDDSGFVPMSWLNDMRRRCLQGLRENILKESKILTRNDRICSNAAIAKKAREFQTVRAKSLHNAGEDPFLPEFSSAAQQDKLHLTALVRTAGQLQAALAASAVERIVAETALFMYEEDPAACCALFADACSRAGKTSGIAFPYVDRQMGGGLEERNAALFEKTAPRLVKNGLGILLVRSTETLAHLLTDGLDDHIQADAGLYTMNSAAQEFLRELGVRHDTAPFELNERELFKRDNKGSELVIYGRIPLMISAQCMRKNTEKCLCPPGRKLCEAKRATDAAAPIVLTDRERMKFEVKNECCFCYNIVYNSVPLYLMDEYEAIRKMKFASVRLSFTDESAEETEKILKAAGRFASGENAAPEMPRTRGHFRRGVA